MYAGENVLVTSEKVTAHVRALHSLEPIGDLLELVRKQRATV